MKPKPTTPKTEPEYPNRRDFIQKIGLIAAGTAVSAVALGGERLRGKPRIAGGMRAPVKTKKFCPKTCGKEIDVQVKLLNNKDFKVRKQATANLIAMGKGPGKDKVYEAKQKALVLARMEKLKTAKDPETAQRAKAIILAVNPPKKTVKKPAPRVELMGDIAIDQ